MGVKIFVLKKLYTENSILYFGINDIRKNEALNLIKKALRNRQHKPIDQNDYNIYNSLLANLAVLSEYNSSSFFSSGNIKFYNPCFNLLDCFIRIVIPPPNSF